MSVDAPERIWVYHNGNSQTYLTAPNKFHNIEYVLADKLEELAAEAHEWKERVQYLSKCIDEKSAEEDRLKAALAERDKEIAALRSDRDEFMRRLGSHWFLEQSWFPKSVEARNAGGKDAE